MFISREFSSAFLWIFWVLRNVNLNDGSWGNTTGFTRSKNVLLGFDKLGRVWTFTLNINAVDEREQYEFPSWGKDGRRFIDKETCAVN